MHVNNDCVKVTVQMCKLFVAIYLFYYYLLHVYSLNDKKL